MNYSEIAGLGWRPMAARPPPPTWRHGPCELTGEADRTVPIRDTGYRMQADVSDDSPSDDSPSGRGRSLVPLGAPPADRVTDAARWRPSAAFLAQLVATAQGAPQTRARRRTTHDHAATLYAAAAARIAMPGATKVLT
jgi:hypothetical protein